MQTRAQKPAPSDEPADSAAPGPAAEPIPHPRRETDVSRSAHPAGPRHADVLPESHPFAPPADLNALDPQVWSRSVGRTAEGVVELAGHDVRDLAAEHGTPAYFLDEADFRARCRAWREAFGREADVFYAGKAFLSRAVVRWLKEEGLNLDVCSGTELAVALDAGMPPERIALHGNNKSAAEIERAVTAGVGRIVLDSFQEIARVAAAAAAHGVRQRVQIRVTVGVEAHTHEFIATAHEDQKFGFSLRDGAALTAAGMVIASDSLELIGLHSHIGSQIFDTAGFEVSAHRLVELAQAIRDEHGVAVEELDLGGGLGIAYVAGDDPQSPKEILERLVQIVTTECLAADLPTPMVSVEPGRAIAGPGTITVYEVGTVKQVTLDGGVVRNYVSVDGGMSDNVRPALYDAEYTCVLASRASTAEPALARVVGKHCESGDIVVRDTWLPSDVRPGDLLAVAATGAYCRSMASNYNHVPRPPVIAVRDGAATVIVRRETVDDLLRLDAGVIDG